MNRPITAGLDAYRKDPADLVQRLPGRSHDMTFIGWIIAVLVGAVLAVLVLAAEGSL